MLVWALRLLCADWLMKMLGFHLRTSKRLGSVLGSVSLPTQGFGCRAVTNNAYMYTYSKKYRNTFSTILTDTEDGSIDNRLHACVWCGYTCMNQVSRTCKWSNTIWAATVTLHQTAGALVERAYQSCRDYQIVQCETRRKALKRWFFFECVQSTSLSTAREALCECCASLALWCINWCHVASIVQGTYLIYRCSREFFMYYKGFVKFLYLCV